MTAYEDFYGHSAVDRSHGQSTYQVPVVQHVADHIVGIDDGVVCGRLQGVDAHDDVCALQRKRSRQQFSRSQQITLAAGCIIH